MAARNWPFPGMSLDPAPAFSGLSADERRQLREWQHRARVIGIDAVEDLTARPWPRPEPGIVIGVFQSGSAAARWLVVGREGEWAVAWYTEGKVSSPLPSLEAALAMIYPGEGEAGAGDWARSEKAGEP